MTELDLEKLGRELGHAEQDDQALLLEMENDMYLLEQEAYARQDSSTSGGGEDCPLLEASTEYYYDSLKRNSADVPNEFAAVVSDVPKDCEIGNETRRPSKGIRNTTKDKKVLRASTSNSFGKSQRSQRSAVENYEIYSLWETVKNILDRTLFQPPVIGALLGICCAVTPARGYFVDLVNRHRFVILFDNRKARCNIASDVPLLLPCILLSLKWRKNKYHHLS
jgi:hypothetical protein